MPPTSLPRVAHRWTPDGRRNRGRPKETWRRTVETEMKKQGWAWVTWRDVLQTDHAGGLRWRPHALPSVKRMKRREEKSNTHTSHTHFYRESVSILQYWL